MKKGTIAMRYRKQIVPDGGWGWVVAGASFMIQVLTNGTVFSFGILFVDLINYFHSTQSATAWLGSIQLALMNLTGILAVPVIHRFGWRVTAITGSIISAIGFGTSALANNIYILYLTYGVLTGTGNGFMFLVSIVTVQQYFDKHRATANGIGIAGAGVGILIFGVMTSYVVAALGWQMMMVVNACCTLVFGVISGALYRPLPYETVKVSNPIKQQKNIPKLEAIQEDVDPEVPDINDENLKLAMTISVQKSSHFNYGSLSGSYEIVESIPVRRSVPIFSIVPSMVNDDELFDFEFIEFPLATESKIPVKIRRRYQAASHFYQFIAIIREMFDLKLMKNPVYALYAFNMIMFTYANSVPYTFLPELALMAGAPINEASLLIPVVGFTSIFARLFFGWLADVLPNRRFDMVGSFFVLLGVLNLLIPCFTNYPSLVFYSALFGIFVGALFTLYPVILLDLIGRGPFDQGLSLVLAMTSIACVSAGPMSGLIIDEIGDVRDVRVPFMVVGGLQIIGVLCYFIIVCIPNKKKILKQNKLFDKANSTESLLNKSHETDNQENNYEVNQSPQSSGCHFEVQADPESSEVNVESDPDGKDTGDNTDSDNKDSSDNKNKQFVSKSY